MTDSDKQALLDGSATIKAQIIVKIDGENDITLTEDDSIISWNHEDFRFVKDEGFIGQFVARQLNGELKNLSNDFSITDKELELKLGIVNNADTTWYSLGNFLVTKVSDDEVNDKTTFEALDYTKKFNKIYEDTITYPCTALELAQNVCEQCGVELETDDFLNNGYVIAGNAFTNGETCRDVMKAIGKLAFSWVRVDWDNKVYIDFSKPTTVNTYNKADNSKYYNLKTQKETFGPVNKIIIGYSQIDGERTYIQDSESIAENGLCELTIYDNPLVYTQAQRESIINSASNLLGLKYLPLNILTVGHPWLKGKELFEVTDMENNKVYTIPFDRTIQYFGHIKTLIDVNTSTKTNTEYAYQADLETNVKKTEIQVDKINGKIESVVSDIGDRSSKTTTITQDIDSIESQVQDIPTIAIENSGTGTLSLSNLANSKLISLRIHPTDRDILGLFASPLLKVASGLKTLSRGVTFDNTDGTQNDLYYKLPDNLYYYDNETYDEFFYDGKEEKIYVIRKVGIENGVKYILDTPVQEDYEYTDIIVEQGDYNVFMGTYPTAYIYVKAMIKNDYTDLFATSYEVDSKITQTADTINLEVRRKVDEDEVISKINQSPEQISISADKINLEANDVLNILAGNTINLTSKEIAIDSTNFKVTKDGNITANSGTFGGTLNTARDCIVGDNLYVGQSQASSGEYERYIKMTENTYIKRWRNQGALSPYPYEVLGLSSDGIQLRAYNKTVFESVNETTYLFGGNQSINLYYGTISMTSQPVIGSDKRLKQEIKDIDASWIDELKVKEFEYIKTPNEKQIGLIAQDYIDKEYSKYFLNQNKEGYYGISYGNITNALIQYCQEMKKQVNKQQEEIDDLKERLEKLEGGNK